MAKSRGGGGSKGAQLNASVNAVTASLNMQRQAWYQVISSLNEYRSIELPDFSQSAPDVAGWQTLTAEVKAYSDATTASSESMAASAAAMQAMIASAAQTKSGLEGVKNEMTSGASASREQLDQTITTIARQEKSWTSLAGTVIGSTASMATAVIGYITSKNTLAIANLNATRAELTLAAATVNAAAAQAASTAAIGVQTTATVVAIPPTMTLAGAVAFLTAPLTLIIGGLTLAAAALYYFVGGSDEASDAAGRTGDAMDGSAKKADSLSLAWQAVAEQAANVTAATKDTAVGLSAVETAQQSVKGGFLDEDTEEKLQGVATEAGAVVVAWNELSATLMQPIVDGAMALGRYAVELLGVKSAAEIAAAMLKTLGSGLTWVKDKANEYITAAKVTARMIATGETEDEAKAYVAQGQAILETSARMEAMTARLEEQRKSYQGYRQSIDDAAASAARGAEMTRIGSITTLAGIEEERAAIGRKATAEIDANAKRLAGLAKAGAPKEQIDAERKNQGKATEERTEKLKKLAELEEGIKSGRVESGVDAATRKTTEAIQELTLGHTENTIATMRNQAAQNGQLAAFEAGLPAYREAQAVLAATKEATDAKKKADEDAERAIQKVADANKSATASIETMKDKIAILNGTMTEAEVAMKAMQAIGLSPEIAAETAKVTAEFNKLTIAKKGTTQISELRDEIDLLNGSTTSAAIAMKKLSEQGFSDEQVSEIGALTAERDRLKDSQKKPGGAKDAKDTAAPALQGSKEAAEIMLRGVGGGNRMESLAGQQLAELKRLNSQKTSAVSANTPLVPPVTPLTATTALAMAAPVLNLQRAGLPETPKVSGISDRVSEPRRENRDKEMVDLLRSQLQEQKLTTSAIKEIEMPNLQLGNV